MKRNGLFLTLVSAWLLVGMLSSTASPAFGQRSSVTGVLVPAPDSHSPTIPHLSPDGNPLSPSLVKLELPGDQTTRSIIANYMNHKATVHGIPCIFNRREKDGTVRRARNIHVERLIVEIEVTENIIGEPLPAPRKKSAVIIGRYSTSDGRWTSITHQNGLWLVDRDAKKTHEIYGPVSQRHSAINWEASAVFAPDEKTIAVRQGLGHKYLRLVDLSRITLRNNPKLASPNEDERVSLVNWCFDGFSPDSHYIVKRKWIGKRPADDLNVYSIETGQLQAFHQSIAKPKARSRFAFLSHGRTFVVSQGQRVFLYDLRDGKRKTMLESQPVKPALRATQQKESDS